MSFFFDVWASEGFVLASDVRIMENEEPKFGHKLHCPPSGSRVPCAMAICGDYPDVASGFFMEAASTKDSLRDLAEAFAKRWTHRFAGTTDYSAVHLVGYQQDEGVKDGVPQLWYWTKSHSAAQPFIPEDRLRADLSSFRKPIPNNNHIPHKILEEVGKFPDPNLISEGVLVQSFLTVFEPYFTWNGDNAFWWSAAGSVSSAMQLLTRRKTCCKINEIAELTETCLQFLARVGKHLPGSTVSLSPSNDCDVLIVKRTGVEKFRWAQVE